VLTTLAELSLTLNLQHESVDGEPISGSHMTGVQSVIFDVGSEHLQGTVVIYTPPRVGHNQFPVTTQSTKFQ